MLNVLILDSGFGGATIVKRIKERCQNLNIIFYIENRHSPLGNLNKNQLLNLTIKIIEEKLRKINIDLLVLACNTLTSACIVELRKLYNFPIIGTEPNIKVCDGKTLVLATNYTINNCEILKDQPFQKVSLPKLSKIIDNNYPKLKKINVYLKRKLKHFKDVQNVICGCTHYYLIQDQIKNILGDVKIYHSVEGVSNRVEQLTKDKINNNNQSIVIELSKNTSKKDQKFLQEIINYLKLN